MCCLILVFGFALIACRRQAVVCARRLIQRYNVANPARHGAGAWRRLAGHRRKLLDAIAALRSDASGKAPWADAATTSSALSAQARRCRWQS